MHSPSELARGVTRTAVDSFRERERTALLVDALNVSVGWRVGSLMLVASVVWLNVDNHK